MHDLYLSGCAARKATAECAALYPRQMATSATSLYCAQVFHGRVQSRPLRMVLLALRIPDSAGTGYRRMFLGCL